MPSWHGSVWGLALLDRQRHRGSEAHKKCKAAGGQNARCVPMAGAVHNLQRVPQGREPPGPPPPLPSSEPLAAVRAMRASLHHRTAPLPRQRLRVPLASRHGGRRRRLSETAGEATPQWATTGTPKWDPSPIELGDSDRWGAPAVLLAAVPAQRAMLMEVCKTVTQFESQGLSAADYDLRAALEEFRRVNGCATPCCAAVGCAAAANCSGCCCVVAAAASSSA